MKIAITLTPENEARLIARATEKGVSVEQYLNSVIADSLAAEAEPLFYQTANADRWIRAFTDWANSHKSNALPLSDEAIGRDSIYREREDSQL